MSHDLLSDLTIGYSVLSRRAQGIPFPRLTYGADVLICVQGDDPLSAAVPEGARVVALDSLGVAKSRNAAILNTRTRYLVFGDDDVEVDLAGVAAGIKHLRETGGAVALGRSVDGFGASRKRYEEDATGLSLFNSAKAATYEILIDVHQVRASGVWFDTRFGAGVPLHLGDEYIFISDLLKAGLTGDAVPFVFAMHATSSSGSRWGQPADSHARAVVLNRVFGTWAPLYRTAFALKHARKLGSFSAVRTFVATDARPADLAPLTAPEAVTDVLAPRSTMS